MDDSAAFDYQPFDYKPANPTPEALAGFDGRLKLARWHRGLRQRDLAAISGVHRQTINRLENNKSLPNIESICRLASGLKVEIEWLAFGTGLSNLPEGEPVYQPEPGKQRTNLSPEERAERKRINQTSHRIAQARGTSFHEEREQLRREAQEQREVAESEDRYSSATPAFMAGMFEGVDDST